MILTVLALASGCGSGVPGAPAAGEIDVRGFDVGKYSVIPLEYRGEYAHKQFKGNELAAMRLAGNIPTGTEIDPSLKYGRGADGITSALNVSMILADVAKPIIAKSGMMFGFSTSAADTDGTAKGDYTDQIDVNHKGGANSARTTSVSLMVIQYPDTKSAASTAVEIEAADFAVAADANEAVTLEKYPEAKGHWRPGIPTLGMTLSHGNYLINVFVQKPDPELSELKKLAQQALSVQLPMLDGLPPLTRREVVRQDYDPQGMFRRVLHPDNAPSPWADGEYVVTARGFLHYVAEPELWKSMIDPAGVDAVATAKDGGVLLRASDAAAATALRKSIAATKKAESAAPHGVPDVSCGEIAKPARSERFMCVVNYKRYVGYLTSSQLTDAQQRAAAQYALLANAEWM